MSIITEQREWQREQDEERRRERGGELLILCFAAIGIGVSVSSVVCAIQFFVLHWLDK